MKLLESLTFNSNEGKRINSFSAPLATQSTCSGNIGNDRSKSCGCGSASMLSSLELNCNDLGGPEHRSISGNNNPHLRCANHAEFGYYRNGHCHAVIRDCAGHIITVCYGTTIVEDGYYIGCSVNAGCPV